MKQHKISFMLVLPLTLVLVLAPVLAFDFASRRGSPTTDVSVESLTLEDNCFSMTAGQGGKSARTFRRASWEIEDDTLYITLFSGLIRSGCRQDHITVKFEEDALREVRQVCLRDHSFAKLIYSR